MTVTTPHRFEFPQGKRFAFTIVDDTDVATVANVKPVYDLLHELGLRTTKTVWPVGCPEGSPNFSTSQTLEDADYRDFAVDLQRRGFEVTWHGATMETSLRVRTIAALQRFHEIFGAYPRIHVNHALNRENVYWGAGRLDSRMLRAVVGRFTGRPADYFTGHIEDSPFWWGDICAKHVMYGRNLTTNDINTARFNPSMPYRDPARPLIPWWFSASDAEGVEEFNELIHPRQLERLEREGGFCVVATHFGKDFVRHGVVNPATRARLEELSQRPGWFPTTSQLLDWLRARREAPPGVAGFLPAPEWRQMQWRFAIDLGSRKLRRGKDTRMSWEDR
ncbi:MAG TPA: hypothetical protein VF962_12530 [Gemmatimonadaceae bacterium]